MYASSCNLPLKIVAFVSGCIFWSFCSIFIWDDGARCSFWAGREGRGRKLLFLSHPSHACHSTGYGIRQFVVVFNSRDWSSEGLKCFFSLLKTCFVPKKYGWIPRAFAANPFPPSSPVYFLRCQRGRKVSKKCMGREKKENSHPPGIIIFSWVSSGAFVRRKKNFFRSFLNFLSYFFGEKDVCATFKPETLLMTEKS